MGTSQGFTLVRSRKSVHRLQWKQRGQNRTFPGFRGWSGSSGNRGVFGLLKGTFLSPEFTGRPPTPLFPMELASRMNCSLLVTFSNQMRWDLDPKAYPVRTGNRERALLLTKGFLLQYGFSGPETVEPWGRECSWRHFQETLLATTRRWSSRDWVPPL